MTKKGHSEMFLPVTPSFQTRLTPLFSITIRCY